MPHQSNETNFESTKGSFKICTDLDLLMRVMLSCTKHSSVGTHGVCWTTTDERIGSSSLSQRAQPAQAGRHVRYKVTGKHPHLTYHYANRHTKSFIVAAGQHTD